MSTHDLFPARAPTRIRVGIGGWTYAPWRNNFYPHKLVQRRELEYASRHLTSIEVNGTYYGAQKPATYAKWRDETPDGFVFSLKAPRHVTERARLADAGGAIDAFVRGGLSELGDRLGPINWQFAKGRPFEGDDFAAFLDRLPDTLDGARLRHVVEVRDASFLCADFLDLVRARRVATVFTDSTEYPSFADLGADFVYARLMGSQAQLESGYAPATLDAWAQRVRLWADGGDPADLPHVAAPRATAKPRDVYVYFISAAKERNPAAAMALIERLR